MSHPYLAQTDSIAELRYRAGLYAIHKFPQHTYTSIPNGSINGTSLSAPSPSASIQSGSHATAALPYSAAQAQQAAFYHAYLQQRAQLDRYHQSTPKRDTSMYGEESDHSCTSCGGERHECEHSDCFSCTSSCSCSSGCDSDTGRKRESRHTRRSSTNAIPLVADTPLQKTAHSSPLATPTDRTAVTTAPPTTRSIPMSKQGKRIAPIHVPIPTASEEIEVVTDNGVDETRAAPAELDETLPADGSESLHVQFSAPVRRRDLSDSVQAEERARIYESALSSITRVEQGFLSHVLTSAQAAELKTVHSSAPLPMSIGSALQRYFIRFEPRGSNRRAEETPAAASASVTRGASGLLGSGNLCYYELSVAGVAGAHHYRLSAEEQGEVRRMAEQQTFNGKGEESAAAAGRYAALLKERKGLSATLERKVGLIPVRRVRELRSGIVPGAVRLVDTVNAHLHALHIAEDELLVAENCVSLLMDSGVSTRRDVPDKNIPSYTSMSTSLHHQSHAAKHEQCVANFEPSICPRVPSSFNRATRTASKIVKREIRRNQRKQFATTHLNEWGTDKNEIISAGDLALDAHAVATADAAARNAAAGLPSHPIVHIPPSVHSSWVVIACNSKEEAHTLMNALMFLKLLAGQNVSKKVHPLKKEIVQIPPPIPSPSASPHKKSRHGQMSPSPIEPIQLTDILLTASQHASEMDAIAAQRQAASAAPRHTVLKRKSVPTPSVHTTFSMPSTHTIRTVGMDNTHTPTHRSVTEIGSTSATSLTRNKGVTNKENVVNGSSAIRSDFGSNVSSEWSGRRSASKSPTKYAPHLLARAAVEGVDLFAKEAEHDRTRLAEDNVTQLYEDNSTLLAHEVSLTQHAQEPRPSVAEWLQRKASEDERTRRRAERKAKRIAEARVLKQAESVAALEKWQRAQAEREAAKEVASAKQRADENAANHEKHRMQEERKAAAQKAYAAFLERTALKAAAAAKKENLSKAHALREAAKKKRQAKERFAEWIQNKSDWFIGRVKNIKDKETERKLRGDGEMNGQSEQIHIGIFVLENE
jgi:hypothetical protein